MHIIRVWQKVAVQYASDTFVVNQKLPVPIQTGASTPVCLQASSQQRQHAKRQVSRHCKTTYDKL